ncbi:hypothetical protein SAMN05660653_03207 [Desulfonatronum thiosulfatophilum]|uniref:DUF3618 domain-containing protein n=1 Tax=Desulfonatronum thiosulfatophilum TaxID=617002 RepID=A0A1G6EVT6_9BACT|nr:hypothetical protein [Desulfonatronum thiosulfatophilum]SDB61536.1 hypothetical protein SAMN05660653_03207 [Desulfonatronum thiosulfatophilum]
MNDVTGANNTPNSERSVEDIRQDIAREKENISHTVEQIGSRFKSKMDWREQVSKNPYISLGVAASLGYLASRALMPRPTPLERLLHPIADEVRDTLQVLMPPRSGPGIIRLTLTGIATRIASNMLKDASKKVTNGVSEASAHSRRGSTTGMPSGYESY